MQCFRISEIKHLYDVKRKPFHMPKYFFHKKYRDFIFFSICFWEKKKKKMFVSFNTSKWDETLFWQTPENKPINVVQTFPPVVAITDKTTSKNLSQRKVYNLLHQSTFLIKVPASCFIHNVWASSGPMESHLSNVIYKSLPWNYLETWTAPQPYCEGGQHNHVYFPARKLNAKTLRKLFPN